MKRNDLVAKRLYTVSLCLGASVLRLLLFCSGCFSVVFFFGRGGGEYSFPFLKVSRTHFTVMYRRISLAVALTAAGLYLFIIALYFPWTKRCIKSHVTC